MDTRATPTERPTRKARTGPDRRTFLRHSWLLGTAGTLGAFGLASIGFLWPRLGGGFGAEIHLGTVEALLTDIEEGGGRFEYPAGRLYMVAYDPAKDPEGVYLDVTGGGPVMALYQKCVHLGCRVPWCASSNWFECPCHGSQYNRWGEYRFGPAPRGLDRFPTEVRDGEVYVNTGQIVTGPSRGTDVLGQPPAGAHCT